MGDLRELSGEFLRNDLCGRDAARRKPLYALQLIMFKAFGKAVDPGDILVLQLPEIIPYGQAGGFGGGPLSCCLNVFAHRRINVFAGDPG